MTRTYTHVGYRPHTGYRHMGKLANHYSPVEGKRHALNAEGDGFRAVCGEFVQGHYDGDGGFCGEVGLGSFDTAEKAENATGVGVTCARCRRLIGVQKWAVQARCPGSRKWYSVKGHDQYATRDEAEVAMQERNRINPHQARRVRQV